MKKKKQAWRKRGTDGYRLKIYTVQATIRDRDVWDDGLLVVLAHSKNELYQIVWQRWQRYLTTAEILKVVNHARSRPAVSGVAIETWWLG